MKVLILGRGFPCDADPVYGNFEFEQASALAKQNIDVIYAYIDRRTKTKHPRKTGLYKQYNSDFPVYGGYLFPVVTFRYFPRLSSWLYSKRFLRLFKMIVEKEGLPNLIHCHYLFCLPCAIAVGKKYNIPIVETEHWSDLKKDILPFYANYMSQYYKATNKIIAVSNALQTTLNRRFGVNSTVINNMVSDTYFESTPTLTPSSFNHKNNTCFISIGSLIHRKGFDILIEAFHNANIDKTKWKLFIIGDGAERDCLEKIIREKGLYENIILLGKLNKQEISDILQKSDVFVLPSRSETFGVVYIEAMARGLPCIGTRCGGPEEFITSDVGLLTNVNDTDALRDAILWMFKHNNEYDRTKIRQICYDRFSSTKIAKQCIEIYNEVLNNYTHNNKI